jgi:hypothetical protein
MWRWRRMSWRKERVSDDDGGGKRGLKGATAG